MGRITHLVNNAGGAGPNDPLTLSVERFEEIMRFNVSSAYHLSQLCVPHMREAGSGNIINITSGAARYAQTQFSAYGTAKAALSHMTRLLAQDFAPQVRVNAIAPGPMESPIVHSVVPDEKMEQFIQNIPVKALGSMHFIAETCGLLASPNASFVTGATWDINGGLFMR